jgi:hypothetical protein
MSTTSNSYFKILLVIVAWLICIIVIYAGRDHDTIFNYFAGRVFVVAASIITLIVFFRDKRNYREKQPAAFAATITAGICIAILLLIVWLLKQRDNTPTILYASAGKLSSASIDLRENNTFKITRRQLLSADYFRGPYIIEDSLLILDSVSALEALDANKYVIRSVPYNDSLAKSERKGYLKWLISSPIPDTTAKVYLIPINAQGTVIENARQFHVGMKPPGD